MKCVLLKLVSGEELIVHIRPEEYDSQKHDCLALYDPYLLKIESGKIMITMWMIGSLDSTFIIAKEDIMVRSLPTEQYEKAYDNLLEEKYNMTNSGEEDIMELNKNKIIMTGPDSIN